ncbi:MAG: RNA polymerase sigma factor [Proteobacteria bacterium]|nr:RNA polymerase sigma factor [Pseudomonadota bacterium]
MGIDVEALYRRYGDMVLGRCRSILRSDAEAQDACQEVFLKVHRYRHTFRNEAKPSTYLFRVTTTVCLNRIRSRGRRKEDLVDDPTPVPVVDGHLNRTDLREVVSLLMDEADEKTQLCVLHHVVDGMTHAEIGKMMGLSGAAIRKRIATFKKKIMANPPSWLGDL